MAGRGRGGQSQLRQLENASLEKCEIPVVDYQRQGHSTTPSPHYPPLLYKPLPLPPVTKRQEYELTLMKVDMDRMSKSMFAIKEERKQPEIERYSDKYLPRSNMTVPLLLHWPNFPQELWPRSLRNKRKKTPLHAAGTVTKKLKEELRSKRLDELEAKEEQEGGGGRDEGEEEEGGGGKKEAEEDEEVEEQDDEDEEIDDGTDYAEVYFDNGENDVEEEDLEEGGVY